MDQENQTPHKRRVRYKGKYPKKFEEKYKELQPEKYQDTIQHVIQKGNTPAGMHISIMVKEILDFLEQQILMVIYMNLRILIMAGLKVHTHRQVISMVYLTKLL